MPPPAVAVTGALLMVYEPFAFVTSKLARPVPLTTGSIVVVPIARTHRCRIVGACQVTLCKRPSPRRHSETASMPS